MKFRPTEKGGGVMVQLGARETGFPETPLPVFNLRKILVPIDFSACSEKALGYAIPLAEQFGAELTLLHVAPVMPPVSEVGPVNVGGTEEVARSLEMMAAKVRTALPKHNIRCVVRTGEPQFEITGAARELSMDLIVLATHGRTGFARVLLGSTAEKVVRHAGCPILVVRENEHEFVTEMGPGRGRK